MLNDLSNGGERFIPSMDGAIKAEHFHRYLTSKLVCKNERVLDIASGEGFGAALLSEVAEFVYAVDISVDAIEHAKTEYSSENLEFIVGDVRKIPLEDSCVSRVVSFETIEHIVEHDVFLSEIKRCLQEDGMAIISTPILETYRQQSEAVNEHHLKELSRNDFLTLLKKYFKHVVLYDQMVLAGSFIAGNISNQVPGLMNFSGNVQHAEGIYTIAVCSDVRPVELRHTILNLNENPAETLNDSARLRQEKINARSQIEYRDEMITLLETSIHEEKINARAQIEYRDEIIKSLSARTVKLRRFLVPLILFSIFAIIFALLRLVKYL